MSHQDGGCCGGGGDCCSHEHDVVGGIEHPGVLDAFAHDTRSGRLLMAMYEARPWDGGEKQLFQLQEKLNAYLSFALDGELKETYPQLADLPLEIQLRTLHEPGKEAWGLISRIREQLAFQEIAFEVIQVSESADDSCCH
jgi:hypothetical protein